jgi:hypothetical protein
MLAARVPMTWREGRIDAAVEYVISVLCHAKASRLRSRVLTGVRRKGLPVKRDGRPALSPRSCDRLLSSLPRSATGESPS